MKSLYNATKLFAGLLILSIWSISVHALPTLLHNIKGYSINDGELMTFDSMLFEDDVIIAVGKKEDIAKKVSFSIAKDGKGATVLPGLIDAHGHLLGLGLNLTRVDVRGLDSLTKTLSAVRQYAKQNPQLRWIQGRGWNQVLWRGKEFPDRFSLDAISSSTPIWLSRIDGHAGWANSKALELAGITDKTPDPIGGKIVRDAQGRATGILIDTAMDFVKKSIPPLNDMERQSALESAFEHLLALGITSVHDAGIDFSTYRGFVDMHKNNNIPLRVYGMIAASEPHLKTMLEMGKVDLPFLKIQSVKVYSDGALGSRGAAMIEAYSDDADNHGLLLQSDTELRDTIEMVHDYDFQVNVHAIGDKSNRLVLDNFERLKRADEKTNQKKSKESRHRIEHAQIVNVDDLARFADLNVIASMQPTHATSDMNMAGDRVGEERLTGAYAWKTLLEQDVIIASGSDFPVELANPFYGLHAAVTRQSRDNQPEDGWRIEEVMSLEQALKSFTIDAAYAGYWEDSIGSLEAGKQADFIVIDRDIFDDEPHDIWKATVLETWIGGKLRYKAE